MAKEENKDKEKKISTNKKVSSTTKNGNTKKKDVESKKQVVKEEKAKEKIEEIKEEVVIDEEVEEKTQTKKIKIGDILLIGGLVLILVLGFFLMKGEKPVPGYELPLTLSGDAGLHQLTYAEYQEKVDNDEEFVLIIERATCSHCVTYMPIAEQFATDNNVPMYYVDTDTFGDDDWNGFERSNSYLRKANGNWGTPTTLVQAGSSTVDFIEGATTVEALLELYNNNFKIAE